MHLGTPCSCASMHCLHACAHVGTQTHLHLQYNVLNPYMDNCVCPGVMQQRYLLSSRKTAGLQQIHSVWASDILCFFSSPICLMVTCWFIWIHNLLHLIKCTYMSVTLARFFSWLKNLPTYCRHQGCEVSVALHDQISSRLLSPSTFSLCVLLLSLFSSPYPCP